MFGLFQNFLSKVTDIRSNEFIPFIYTILYIIKSMSDLPHNQLIIFNFSILELLELRKSATDFLKISPKNYVQIAPDKKFQFSIEFMPTERLESFTEKVFLSNLITSNSNNCK